MSTHAVKHAPATTKITTAAANGSGARTDPARSTVAVAADSEAAAALPPAIKSVARARSRRACDLLANPEHESSLHAHTAALASSGVDIDAAIANAKKTAAGFNLAQRLQNSADRAWQAIESSEDQVKADAKAIARVVRGASEGSTLRKDLGAFVEDRAHDLGTDKRLSARRKTTKAKPKTPAS